MGPRIMRFLGIVRCDFKTTLTPLCHPYQIAETSILDSRKEILTKMQLPRAIITSKLEKCLKITHLPTSSKKSDKKGKIAIRIFFFLSNKISHCYLVHYLETASRCLSFQQNPSRANTNTLGRTYFCNCHKPKKSVSLEYNMLVCWADWNKHFVDQASDIPSIIFFS